MRAVVGEALEFYRLGYRDLISVIPPGAELAAGSRMQTSSLGKAPGRRLVSGLWAGYAWRSYDATEADIAQWMKDGASFGLRADRFPGLDIDVMDEQLANEIEQLAREELGGPPIRFGRAPKRLLMYRAEAPINRMRLWLERDGVSHLVELLGAGQQYLVFGTHPVTQRPYIWVAPDPFPVPAELYSIDRAQVEALFSRIAAEYGAKGWTIYREGDGYARSSAATDQAALRAPSIDALQAVVDKLPNDDAHYAGRDAYIRVGYAIRAAAGDAVEEGFEVFASWAQRHPKDVRVSGNPATWRADYDRMRPPYSIGWGYLREEAQRVGHNTAQEDFTPIAPFGQPTAPVTAPDRLPNGDDPGHSLAEYLERPELADMPPELVPHFAWAGLKTLLSGREKTGKSTLLLSGIAAATRGDDFLGGATEPRTVVWLTEEAIRLTVRRAVQMKADPDRLKIVRMGKEPTLQLAHAVGKWSPDIVVIDTLFRYASVEDENNASQWRPFLEQFDRVTERGAALVLVVHALKAHEDGRYRGSSALGGWVDVIAEMANPQPESTVRNIACKGRVDVDTFSVRLDNGEFRLLTDDQKQRAKDEKKEREALAWVTDGKKGRHPGKAVLAVLAERGLIVQEKGAWRATTADEQAQAGMGL
jgi:AAA domain